MPFVSFGFPLYFGLTMLLYRVLPARRGKIITGASLLFYLRAGGYSLPALLLVTAITWAAGKWKKRAWGIGALAALLAAARLGVRMELWSMPLGLSYYLLAALALLTQGEGVPFGCLLGQLGFFPQMVQGPIHRVDRWPEPKPGDLSLGILRLLWGYFKKLVIADRLMAPAAILQSLGPRGLWTLSAVYALQIYMDFTGGMDMALGMARCFGVRLPENFRFPFLAKSLQEYWQRWHITLGQWMGRNIFFPVSACRPLRRAARKLRARSPAAARRLCVYTAMVITWLTTGLWHGFHWNFALWGLLNCGVLLLSQELEPVFRRLRRPWMEGKAFGLFRMIRTWVLVNLIRVCDLYPEVSVYFRGLVTPEFIPWSTLRLSPADTGVLLLALPLTAAVQLRFDKWESDLTRRPGMIPWLAAALALIILIFGQYGIGHDPGNFVYGQF